MNPEAEPDPIIGTTIADRYRVVRLIAEGRFGSMVALRPPAIAAVPIAEALAMPKRVPLDSDTIATARDLGISLGD